MYCSGCGKKVPDNKLFCPYCGKKIGQTEPNVLQDDREEELSGFTDITTNPDDHTSPEQQTQDELPQPVQQDDVTNAGGTDEPLADNIETAPDESTSQKKDAQASIFNRLVNLLKAKKSIAIGVAAAIVLVLVFGVTEALKVTVSFNGNGSDRGSVSDARVSRGSTLKLPDGSFSREGYTFIGWSTDYEAEEAQYSPGDEIEAQDDAVFFAVWDPITCHVTYDGNGQDSGSMETLDIDYEAPFDIPECGFKRAWYVCKGWSTEPDAHEPTVSFGDSAHVTQDVTLYAVWEPDGDSIVKAMEVSKESMVADDGTYVMVALVKSKCDLNVQLSATLTAYDASGKEIGAKKDTIKVIAKDETIPVYEYIEGGENIDHFECELALDGETSRNPVASSVSTTQLSDGSGVLLLSLDNHSDKAVEDVYIVCLGYIDGKLAFAARQGVGTNDLNYLTTNDISAGEKRTTFVESDFFNEDYKVLPFTPVGMLPSGGIRRCEVYVRS